MLYRQIQQLLSVGLEHMKVQAKRLIVGFALDAQNFGLNLVGRNRGTGQKSKTTSVGRANHQIGASHIAHGRLNDGVAATEQIAQRGAQCIDFVHHAASFLLAETMDLAS